jgi:hypothetical protein
MHYFNNMCCTKSLRFRNKNVAHQLSEFLTEHSSKCIISQREWPLSTSCNVLLCFSHTNNSAARRQLSTYDHSVVRDTVCPDFRTLPSPNSLMKSRYSRAIKFADTKSMCSFPSPIDWYAPYAVRTIYLDLDFIITAENYIIIRPWLYTVNSEKVDRLRHFGLSDSVRNARKIAHTQHRRSDSINWHFETMCVAMYVRTFSHLHNWIEKVKRTWTCICCRNQLNWNYCHFSKNHASTG